MNIRLLSTLVSTLVLSTAPGFGANFTLNIPTGSSAIGDPLDNGGGNWPSQLNPTGALDFSLFYKWNCSGWTIYTIDSTMSTGFADQGDNYAVPAPVMSPGEGAFFNNNSGADASVILTGTLATPVLPVPLPCGCGHFNLLTLQTLGAGTYQNITGLSPQTGAQVQQWNGSQWTTTTFSNGVWSPVTPSLTNGVAAFFYVPCPCITLTSFSNKSLLCSTNWNFDAPTNIVDLCCTNFNLAVSTFTNNAPCPLVVTRTWWISDICGNSNSCSQTVTVNCCTNYGTNCCANCTSNNYVSFTNTVYPGDNFLANNLCQGTNDSVNSILTGLVSDPNGVMNTVLWIWNSQGYYDSYTYFTAADAATYFGMSAGSGWYDPSGNLTSATLSPGDGFVLQNNSGASYPVVIRGCPPTCPPPCEPTNGVSPVLVGRLGVGTATWTDLFSCPPPCGAQMLIWNVTKQAFTEYDYASGVWTPFVPVLAAGQSAFVSVHPNTNCLPCTNNLVVNGSFEQTSPAVAPNSTSYLTLPSGLPGWTITTGNTLEVWGNTLLGIPAAAGTNHMEINSQSNDQTVWQVLTNLDTNCLATFFFNYTGRFGIVSNTYNNDFTVTLSTGNTVSGDLLSVDLDPATYSVGGWTNFTFGFYPPPTVTIGFRGHPHYVNSIYTQGGAHIDNVLFAQCCHTNPCITMTCAGDKAVPCGTNWVFDAPMNIVDNCCANYSVAFSAVTNSGPCPLVITGTWLISDACGNSNTCSQTVTVVDTVPPTITCPSNIVVTTCGTNAVVTYSVTATDNCCTNVMIGCNPPSGYSFPLGSTTVSCTATDCCGNVAYCGFTVMVVQTPAVIITCPPSIFTNICGSNVVVYYPTPTVTNGTLQNCVPASGSVFPLGMTGVTCTATNACGTNACTFNVTVTGLLPPQSWTPEASMQTNRYAAAAELLPSGRVLVAGGITPGVLFSTMAEVFDPMLNGWANGIPALPQPHRLTSARLADGRVLVAGDDASLNFTAYLYDEGLNQWISAGIPNSLHVNTTLTRLNSGHVLMVGGYCGGSCATYSTAEIFQLPSTWTTTVSMATTRHGHTATLLPSGQVLVAGGAQRWPVIVRNSCELFTEGSPNTWSLAATMNQPRVAHTATLLPNGKVLVVGGITGASATDPYSFGPTTATAEIYDPALNTWTPAASMSTPRNHHTATLLACGKLLIAGGQNDNGPLNSCEIYDYVNNSWSYTAPMSVARAVHTATLLPSGQVFVAGGLSIGGIYLASSELYTPGCCCGSTNKTVACGTAWSFDVPSSANMCDGYSTNPVVFSTVTNGLCPQVMTRTWVFTNACGYSNFCSQTVTVASCVPPPSGMVSWWPGDGNGSDIIDANNGTLMTGVSFVPGEVGQAFSFDGTTSGYVAIPDSASLNLSYGNTIDLWVKVAAYPPNGAGAGIIVNKWASAQEDKLLMIDSTGKVYYYLFNCFGGTPLPSSTALAIGTWYHIAATYDGVTAKIYINGVLNSSKPASGTVGNAHGKLYLGYNPSRTMEGMSSFTGLADEIEWFNRALTTNEITAIYLAGPAGKCKSPELVCATNKVVPCGSNWSFDPPVVNTPCNGTNATLFVLNTVTNGVCPTVVTRTWLVVDGYGYTNTCSQTVSIVDTTPPVITCPSNIVVTTCNSNAVVTYTVTATDNCCTNVVIGCNPPSGYAFPLGSTTVSCTATDCCGNVAYCGFTVTVNHLNDTTPPIFTTYCATNHYLIGGNNFTSPVAATPSANLLARLHAAGIQSFKNFDECKVNSFLAHTFGNLPPCITSATLTFLAKPCGDVCINDSVGLSFTGAGGILSSNSWGRYLGGGNSSAGLVTNNWCSYTGGQMFTLDLSALPQPNNAPSVNFIPALNANGFLDFTLQDDSGVDYAILDVVSCCCATNKFVAYGTPWSFDQPTAYDAVSGTNVTITYTTYTNSLCPLVVTRTWTATDPCGNSSICSQTVIVGQSGPCQIFNTGMTGTNGNIPVAAGLPDPNFVLLSSPGAGNNCVVVGTLPTSWVTNTATSQWVGPTINPGNSSAGIYHYQLVFILCCTNNAQLTGRMAVDDSAGLYLNGSPAGSVTGFSSYTPINLINGFVPGLNVLDIYVTNGILATGLRAELTVCAGGLIVICPTNKVVDCGSKWSFDVPTASSCCSNNISITLISAGTNGICPKIATNMWRITDGCGNTNLCTQIVTIRDTVPPVVFCPTNKIIVALDSNCMVHIPLIHPQSSDNCTPASQLIYVQNPPVGSALPGPCQMVTVNVTDACGNSTSCQVMVCGQDKTPPTVNYPKSITVSNCVVPNVLPFVSASDNCTPSNLLSFTQSPVAGTPIAAGGNIITVTVTDLAGNTTTIIISLATHGANSFLNVLYNTAVNGSKAVLPGGFVDPHYTLGPVPGGILTGAGYYNVANAVVVSNFWGLPPFTMSAWIDPGVNVWSYPFGFYTYTNQFTLPFGANPLTASISGRWAADDGATMYLNGLALANKVSSIAPSGSFGFNHWTPFTISSGILGNPTVNKLYFVVTNAAAYGNSPSGLRVEFTNAVVNCYTCTPPGIVSMTANQSRPLNSTVVFNANVSGTPPLTYQWYYNNVPLVNNSQYSGVTTPTLTISGIGYTNAGTYYVCIGNPCGGICSVPKKLTISHGWPWWWAWWNFAQIGNPLAATVGPDLILTGTNTFGISSGSTADFGLPNIGGQVANVINVQPLPGDTFIQLPFIGPPTNTSVSSYTVLMDVLMPTNGIGTNTIFEIGSSGQDSLALRAIEGVSTTQFTESGTVGGVPVNAFTYTVSANPSFTRVALVMDQPDDNAAGDATMTLYVNGTYASSYTFYGTPHVPVLPMSYLADVPATLLSSPEGTSGETYAASIQFHAVAMTAEMIAGLGGPDTTPMPANDTSVGVQPVLSATTSNGVVSLSWTGSGYVLQEATDLSRSSSFFDVWLDCMLPFTESQVGSDILTVAHPYPQDGPAKFYRLIFAP